MKAASPWLAVALALGACAPPSGHEIAVRTDLARDCREEGQRAANAWAMNALIPTPGRFDRVKKENEEACLARPLNAAEQERADERQRQAAARDAQRREQMAEAERQQAATREREAAMQRYRTAAAALCGGRIEGPGALLMAPPFAIAGRCYEILLLGASQWLSPTRALVLNYGVLFESDSPISTELMGAVIVRGVGAFEYEAASGAARIVPHVRRIDVRQ